MNPYRDHPVVLLGGGYNALSAARSLGRSGCQVHLGLAATGSGVAGASRFVTSSMRPTTDDETPAQWLEWLRDDVPPGSVVLPCSDPALELVARHRPELTTAGLHVCESDDELVLAMLDKQCTYDLARAVGIRAPGTQVVQDVAQGLAAAEAFALPFAIKPRMSHRFLKDGVSTPKAVVIRDRAQLEAALARIVALELPVVLTEIVPGGDERFCSYYTYVDAHGQTLVRFTKRKLRQYPTGFGSGTYHLTDADPEVAELGARLFEAVGLLGIGNVEFKRDERDGQLTLIECNLRLTAANELVRRAGVDLADVVYRRALGLPVGAVDDYRVGLSQWLPLRDALAVRQARGQGGPTARAWLTSVARPHVWPVLDRGDLGPTRARSVDLLQRSRQRGPAATAPAPSRRGSRARLLGLAVSHGSRGKLGGAVVSELAVLSGLGLRDYRRRWDVSSPVETVPPGRSRLYRRYWAAAAELVGAELVDLGGGLLEVCRGASTTRVWDSLVPLDNPLTLRVAGDKPATRARLTAAGLPVTEQVVIGAGGLLLAERFLARARVVVVKPARSGGGQGVTCGVRRPEQLVAAVALAMRFCDQVVLERLTLGQEFRLLVLDGEVVGTVRRRPPTVVGDGSSSLGQLIAAENGRRRADPAGAGLYPITIDLDAAFTLAHAGLTLRSVPPAGVRVAVKTAVNENGPADNEAVLPSLALTRAAVAAAQTLGLSLAAVEVITPDPLRPLTAGGAVVEVNTTPGLHYHYQVSNPDQAAPVAAAVLEHLLQQAEAQQAPISALLASDDEAPLIAPLPRSAVR